MASKRDPVRELTWTVGNLSSEAADAMFDNKSLAIACVGGAVSLIAGIALAPVGLAIVGVGGAGATILAYLGKVVYDIATVTREESIARAQTRILGQVGLELDQLEGQLVAYHAQYAYVTEQDWYTLDEFQERRNQLAVIFEQANEIDAMLKGEQFGEGTWAMIMPEIERLVQIAVRLYQQRLFQLGTLFSLSVSGNEQLDQLRQEVEVRRREVTAAGRNVELRARRQQAYEAVERQLAAYEQSIANPTVVLAQIDLIEADFDIIRSTLGSWLLRLRTQASAVGPSLATIEAEELRQELSTAVDSLRFTQEAQDTMAAALRTEVSTGLHRVELAKGGQALSSSARRRTKQ